MTNLPYRLDRTVVIQAAPETVFRFFTDSARWASWWGAGSTIDARPGGKVRILNPGQVEVTGEVLEVRPPDLISFTYGFTSGKPIPPGASRVTIRLEPAARGTRVNLTHEFPEAAARDEHVQGWRFQLSLFSNVVANEVYANAPALVDAWFAAWIIPEDTAREAALAAIVTPGIQFRDRYSLLDGIADLTAHAGAAQKFMPGIRMQRQGNVRHCQGTVLADWIAAGPDGKPLMQGTNVFVLGPDARIESVTGLSNAG